MQTVLSSLETRFGGTPSEFRGELTLTIEAGRIVDASRFLKDEAGFEMLLDITAVDYCPRVAGRFHLV